MFLEQHEFETANEHCSLLPLQVIIVPALRLITTSRYNNTVHIVHIYDTPFNIV